MHSQFVLRLCPSSLGVLVRHGHLEDDQGVLEVLQAHFVERLALYDAELHSDVAKRVQELSRAANS